MDKSCSTDRDNNIGLHRLGKNEDTENYTHISAVITTKKSKSSKSNIYKFKIPKWKYIKQQIKNKFCCCTY